MKTYVKPVAEIREFEVTNKIASLQDWLNSNDVVAEGITADAITSYYLNS
ncbi:MAG: hypothetical protein IKT39_01965 [Clostridia bacterium]|nr:hypothetical protein [Clostridia bacterium]